tara:strand:+ start:359 stop:922 length:564 start_codon:yes stop_codon:yes gene_type:complete
MKLDEQLEERLKSEAIKHLEQGKPDWDIPHTLATVYWMRQLIEKEGGDERILVTTMYLHDIGYDNLKQGYNFDDLMKTKMTHAEISVREAENILKRLEYSNNEIKEIIDLVRYHDTLDNIDTPNRQLVMEADCLAAIDWERVTPNFDKENTQKYLDYFKETKVDKFQTETGKRLLKELLQKAENYWN